MKKFFLLAVTCCAGLFLYGLLTFWTAARNVYEPGLSGSTSRFGEISADKDPVMLLLLGVDKRSGDVGRADSITVAAIHPGRKNVLLVNFPRDLIVPIPGRSMPDKINHSFAYGGSRLTRLTVEAWTGLPVDGVVRVDMDGLSRVVDALGGVDVEVPFDFTFEGIRFRKGTMHLSGREALAFARMRKEDPRGDYGRIKRQQAVMLGIVKRLSDWSSLSRLDDVAKQAGEHLKTDIPPMDWIRLKQGLSGIDASAVQTDSVRANSVKLRGIWYLAASDKEKNRIRSLLEEATERRASANASR
ncbi:LCP family protein [Staphylospora marina]|uniref:LCP family protein n=1 Tax=Staphylospora marina TaxID=2490858 RepID=UPI0013DDA893|nr:LCP family protein [Staphylospora marina]